MGGEFKKAFLRALSKSCPGLDPVIRGAEQDAKRKQQRLAAEAAAAATKKAEEKEEVK